MAAPVAAEAAVAEAGRGLAAIDIGTVGSTAAAVAATETATPSTAAAAVEGVAADVSGGSGGGNNVDVTGVVVDDLTPSGLQGSDAEEGHLSGLSDLESLMEDQVCL